MDKQTVCCDNTFSDKINRTDAFFTATQSICPTCRKTIQAKILFRSNQVLLSKRCLEHGEFEALLSPDMEYWLKSLSYTKPGTLPKEWSTPISKGCPDDCGLCQDHEQHTCSPIIEISNHCDLKCPICIVWNQNNYNISVAEFKSIIDGLLIKEGSLDLVLLSGGEPTLHPHFFELCEYVVSKPNIKRVLISSHGIRLAQDDAFARRFKELGLYLSLQFDSLEDNNYKQLRGAGLLKSKMKCLDRCAKYSIPTIFVPAIARGYNEHEIGSLVDFAFSLDFVTSVTIQPAAYTGSGGTAFPHDPLRKLTQVDIHRLLAEQTDWLKPQDFLPIPCSHPSCYTACYLLKMDDKRLKPLTHFADITKYLDLLTNRAIMDPNDKVDDMIQDAIYQLWSAQAVTVDTEQVLSSLKTILNEYGAQHSDIAWRTAETRVKAIFIHAFMDEYDFELSRIRKCCTHYALPDGRLMPGCAYNNVHRFHDSRLGLKNVLIPQRQSMENGLDRENQ